MNPFSAGEWIWSPNQSANQYVLFVKDFVLPHPTRSVGIRMGASYHYELYVNGVFVPRGPVHGDPQWCQYDDVVHQVPEGVDAIQVAIVVHHASDIHLHYLLPAPGGVIAEITVDDLVIGTDATWRCLDLAMWAQGVPPRGWALDYCEDYDAGLEPDGWASKVFAAGDTAMWTSAVPVPGADAIWAGYQSRMVPYLQRHFAAPVSLKAHRAPHLGPEEIGDISRHSDTEPLEAVTDFVGYEVDKVNVQSAKANAFTFDLGRECIGFYMVEVEAPAGTVFEISGAELLRDGRPWVFRKNTRYSVRYRSGGGRRTFVSFGWSGFRYLHVVIRGDTTGVRIHRAGCLVRQAALTLRRTYDGQDPELRRIFDLCRYTLEVGAQEHLVDCPTREQTQYWGDALHIADSLWVGFGERGYLEWYLEGFLHVPIRDNGQISSTYPGDHTALLDYSLIPVLGQRLYKVYTGGYYRPAETLDRALHLKQWYDDRLDDAGLVAFDYEAYASQDLRNFIDHPGIGWHNFPHPGIDRHGVSCPLNLFFYGFVRALAEIAASLERSEASGLTHQAEGLATAIRETFYDGLVFHDAVDGELQSSGTAWQTNALAVTFDVVTGDEATRAMRAMLDGYDTLCRCSPYFHFYFLPALRTTGLVQEGLELIKREWGAMPAGDATTTWEGFLGDEMDSLCHPWSTAPFLYLLGGESGGRGISESANGRMENG
jgi:alpha-L-rhamnosidase